MERDDVISLLGFDDEAAIKAAQDFADYWIPRWGRESVLEYCADIIASPEEMLNHKYHLFTRRLAAAIISANLARETP